MTDVSYINDAAELASFCDKRRDGSLLMLDTEFLRERTYFPMLCLVQIAVDEEIALIDPLAIDDLEPLWRLITTGDIVLHAARQDLEVIAQTARRLPTRIFDTQIAAALCGYPAQIGYANLAEELLGVSLSKTHTRTDWSRRPLGHGEREYAADDVRYLPGMYAVLTERLAALGRIDWAREDSMRALDPALYAAEPCEAWRRIRALNRLPAEAHARARRLAAWREATAIEKNLPRQWIIKDAALVAIAGENPHSIAELAPMMNSRRLLKSHGQAILHCLSDCSAGEPFVETAANGGEERRELVLELGRIISAVARNLQIDTELIAPKKELKAAAAGDRSVRVLSGWRRELVGDQLLDVLEA